MSSPVAIVTGGGSGIGLAVTDHLVSTRGFRVAIFDVDETRGKAAADRLAGGDTDRCSFHHVDVTKYEKQADAFKQVFKWGGGRLDLYFANAGIADTDSIYQSLAPVDAATGLPPPLNLTILDVDLGAVIQGVHLARHFFAQNPKPGGKIAITASCLGVYASHSVPLYSSAKHALVGLVRSSAPVFAGMNITINALLPVLVETNIWPEHAKHLVDDAQLTPMRTVCKAFDRFLDSEMTGQTVELALDQLIFRQQQDYTNENARWMCEFHELFETAAAPLLPKPPGHNFVRSK
ncbi:hypothetical protein KC343_g15431 [Hortaea werneckii]|uniref:15-hydroxyprostaglandin dehydrogenase n=1 Tax=Hortaea werneckii TaxID=91943 RepID=A0A3M7FUX3_HORWE|nr:hypothetical protein KC352_g25845 [Hortaea werneckii]KAI7549438.1 hypothetical protein KC317_g14566 [Hortaea werneckii]KAI7594090.1 hypothetical protein KC346_g15713 [Hortaea werneckii]KAI7600990.1 hypothetical protein KC343_g15431 [Hortaea werneckii]KAI7647186.1 hypothetical protein KC319_g11686 [Hortaea werneckii]